MDWKPRPRKYDLERNRLNHLNREGVLSHPLKTSLLPKTSSTTSKSETALAKNHSNSKLISHKSEFEDPLSRFAAEASIQIDGEVNGKRKSSHDLASDPGNHVTSNEGKLTRGDDGFELWSQKQSQILSTFTTSQKLSLVALSNKKEVTTKALPTSISEKVRTRLEQLDELEEGFEHETLSLTQEEYVNHINELGSSLAAAWKDDQRVKTLKIAIQCAKLLGDTSSKQFYPSKFVIITEILDNFGHLVFERLLEKAISSSSPGQRHIISVADIDPEMISDTAKETCRNWFYKIASIRELLPRVYVEASLLRCFDFLERGAAECALERLVGASRGAAEPLVSAYLRCYLARVGDSLSILRMTEKRGSFKKAPLSTRTSTDRQNPFPLVSSKLTPTSYLLKSLRDTITSLNSPPFCLELTNKIKYRDSETNILKFFNPAMEWMVRCLSRCVVTQSLAFDRFDLLFQLADQCRDHNTKSLVLRCLINQLPHSYVAERATEIRKMISELEGDDEEISDLYSCFGSSLAKGSDPPEEERRPLLNEVWRTITSFERPRDYSACAEAWSAFVSRHFGRKEVNVLMGDVVRKLSPDRAFEAEQTSLRTMMGNLVGCARLSLTELLALSNFLPFHDLMEGETKVLVCKDVLKKYSDEVRESRSVEGSDVVILSDPVVIHTFMTLCKHLHEQVSAISLDDEVRLIGRLIGDFVGTVRKESDSSQLQFYVECRSSFCNIDPVLLGLVHRVNRLAMNRRLSVNGQEGTFWRACSAYCFITIPSLNGIFHRLNLYLVSGLVALQNGCISQADSLFVSAVDLVAEVPSLLEMDGKVVQTEGMLVEFVRNLCSGLVLLPDPPDRPPLFHFKELLSRIEAYGWDKRTDSKVRCYCSVVLSLTSESQSRLPYKISGIDSNDALYGSDPKFLGEVSKLSSEVLSRIVRHLEHLDGSRAAIAATAVIDQLLCHSDLTSSAPFFRSVWSYLGVGDGRNGPKEMSYGCSSDGGSVSVNVSRVVERVKRLAAEQPQYTKFLALMIS